MVSTSTLVITVISTAFASTGFWAFVTTVYQTSHKKKDVQAQMLKGLGHDRICNLGECYIERGYITKDEYENLHDYLFVPYQKLGGNGTAEKIINDVKRLPLKEKEK